MMCPKCQDGYNMLENGKLGVFWCISCNRMWELQEIEFLIGRNASKGKQP